MARFRSDEKRAGVDLLREIQAEVKALIGQGRSLLLYWHEASNRDENYGGYSEGHCAVYLAGFIYASHTPDKSQKRIKSDEPTVETKIHRFPVRPSAYPGLRYREFESDLWYYYSKGKAIPEVIELPGNFNAPKMKETAEQILAVFKPGVKIKRIDRTNKTFGLPMPHYLHEPGGENVKTVDKTLYKLVGEGACNCVHTSAEIIAAGLPQGHKDLSRLSAPTKENGVYYCKQLADICRRF